MTKVIVFYYPFFRFIWTKIILREINKVTTVLSSFKLFSTILCVDFFQESSCNGCHHHAVCISSKCICRQGYSGDGNICRPSKYHKSPVHAMPEEFDNGVFSQKTHQMFSVQTTPKENSVRKVA